MQNSPSQNKDQISQIDKSKEFSQNPLLALTQRRESVLAKIKLVEGYLREDTDFSTIPAWTRHQASLKEIDVQIEQMNEANTPKVATIRDFDAVNNAAHDSDSLEELFNILPS
jgi:hypothetical protein